jgi:hypothetical protein
MARPRVLEGGDGLQIWRIDANILNKEYQAASKGWSSSLEVGRRATTPHVKTAILLRNVKQGLRLQWILSTNDLSYRKWT